MALEGQSACCCTITGFSAVQTGWLKALWEASEVEALCEMYWIARALIRLRDEDIGRGWSGGECLSGLRAKKGGMLGEAGKTGGPVRFLWRLTHLSAWNVSLEWILVDRRL